MGPDLVLLISLAEGEIRTQTCTEGRRGEGIGSNPCTGQAERAAKDPVLLTPWISILCSGEETTFCCGTQMRFSYSSPRKGTHSALQGAVGQRVVALTGTGVRERRAELAKTAW